MTYDDWLKSVPTEITGDALWKMEVYRLSLLTQIIRLLLKTIPSERGYALRENPSEYSPDSIPLDLLTNVPM